MLKLIPKEALSAKKRNRQQYKKKCSLPDLQLKLYNKFDLKQRFIHDTCADFIQYVEKTATYDVWKIGKLIHNLRRSVLGLEHERIKLLRSNRKRKNRNR